MDTDGELSDDYTLNDGIKRKINGKVNSPNKRHKIKSDVKDEDPSLTNRELYKPPTVEELNQLRETEILFNSNLFRLQTEELLKEVSLKQKRKKEIEEWIEMFEQFLKNLPEINLNTTEKTKAKHKKVAKQILKNIPVNIKADQEIVFNLKKPLFSRIVGLYNVNAAVGCTINININVVMPKACFHEKDYLNSRYLAKKCIYLSYIALHLKNTEFVTDCCYTYFHGNALIPMLKLTPSCVKSCSFNILVTPEEGTFKLARFDPDKSNLRCSYFESNYEEVLDKSDENLNTPFYNSVILQDLTLNSNDRFQQTLIKEKKGVWEGLILLGVWLQQRELCDGFGGFNEDLMYAVVAYLAHINKINKHMSSYQVLRNVWNYLGNSTWNSNGSIISEDKSKLTLFHETHEVVFIDASGHFNLAYDLDANVYLKVKQEASKALLYLDEAKFNSFQALFMTKMNFYLQYDTTVTIFEDETLTDIYKTIEDRSKLDHLYFKQPLIFKHVINLIKIGLSDRIECIVPKLQTNITWCVGKKPKENEVSFSFGIQLNFANIFRFVDKGPPAYDPLAAKFREFWENKADLRR